MRLVPPAMRLVNFSVTCSPERRTVSAAAICRVVTAGTRAGETAYMVPLRPSVDCRQERGADGRKVFVHLHRA
jgi:hypothetical protein